MAPFPRHTHQTKKNTNDPMGVEHMAQYSRITTLNRNFEYT